MQSHKGVLSGYRIAFFTSIEGMGGSEVLVADAMEAACLAGATVDCWSRAGAAVKQILATRAERFQVNHFDWPVKPLRQDEIKPSAPTVPAANDNVKSTGVIKKIWHALFPEPIKELVGYWRYGRAFAKAIAPTRPDLLFVNVNGYEHVCRAAKICGIPLMNCYHLSYTPCEGSWMARWIAEWMRKDSIRRGSLTLHTSLAVRDQWSNKYHDPISKTRIVHNGVDPIPYKDRKATRAKLGLKESDFVICVPGRLAKMKGHRYLLEALPRLGDLLNDLKVLICGDGDELADLQSLTTDPKVSNAVQFLGWRSDLPDILLASDMTVLPSIFAENLSVAVLESLMAGTPAIVTNIGGMSEAIIEGQTGYVVPPRDKNALSSLLSKLIKDRNIAAGMRSHAREDAMKRFTRDRMMKEYVSVFAEILKAKKS